MTPAQKAAETRKRRLTHKEKGFVEDFVRTNNGTLSALNHYDTTNPDVAAAIASENLNKPKIQKAIAEMLPDDLLAERHLELLNKREVSKVDGEIIDVPDTQAVSKGLDMAYKLKGSYAPEKTINQNVNLNITDKKLIDLARKYEEELNELEDRLDTH